MSWAWGPRRIGAVVGTLAALAMALRLFVPGVVGLSGGDQAQEVQCRLGVRVESGWDQDPDAHLRLRSVPHAWSGEQCDDTGGITSHVVVARVARSLGGATGSNDLDLRVLGGLAILAFGIAMGLFAWALPGSRATRLVVSWLVAMVVLDVGVAGTLVSLHGDGTAVIALVFVLASACRVLARREASSAALVALAASGAVLVTATPQARALVPVLVAGLVVRPRAGGGRRPRIWGVLAAIGLVAVAVAAAGTADGPTERGVRAAGVVAVADDQAGALEALGVDPDDVGDLTPARPLEQAEIDALAQVSRPRLARYQATHPLVVGALLRRSLDATASFHLPFGHSSFPESAGEEPYAAETRVGLVSIVFQAFDALPALLVALWAFVAVLAIRLARRASAEEARGMAWLSLGVVAGAVAVAGSAAVLGGTVGLGRHVLLAQVLTAWALPVLAAAYLVNRRPRPPLLLPPTGVTTSSGGGERAGEPLSSAGVSAS